MGLYSKLSDAELVVLLKTGDHAAFTEIYNRYMGVLYLHALKLVKDEDEAQDILHELFAALWTKAPELVLKNTLSAYLYRAVKNRVFDVLTHRKIKQSYLESLQDYIDQGSWNTDETLRAKELSDLIEKEVTHLPAKMREIFELSRKADKSYKEIAEELTLSDKTVKKQINNAIKILRLKIHTLLLVLPF